MKSSTTHIEGTLLMLDDATPHVAVVVQAICDGKVMATTLSDENGRYQFTNLKPGTYQVRCYTLNGYLYYGKDKPTDASHAIFLQVQKGRTLKDIDFRSAPFKKGIWRTYNYLDGLASNWVLSMHRDTNGVMWFGTSGGVSRYDGKEFVKFSREDGLALGAVLSICAGQDGVLWFGIGWLGYSGAGVFRYDGKEFVNFTTEDGLVHNRVQSIHCDPDGVMWFGTGGGVSRYDGKAFANFTTEDGLVNNNVQAMHCDPGGVMWFGTDGGISRYDGKEFVNFTTEDGLVHNRVQSIHCDPDGVMWFGTGGGISRYDGKVFANFTTEDGLVNNNVVSIHCDPDGVMWFGTVLGGVSRYDGKGFVNFTTEDGLVHNRVISIHCDPDGVMWFGTRGGVSQYDARDFVKFTIEDGLVHSDVHAIHRDPDGVMWFGTRGGVSRYDARGFANFTIEDGLVHSDVRTIHRGPDGVMWFGTYGGGVSRYDGKTSLNFTTEDGLAHNRVQSIHCDPDGVMWFGTGGGVSRYDGKAFANFTTEDGLVYNNVQVIHCDPDGVIWFGTSGGVSRYDGKKFVNLTTDDGLVNDNIHAIHCDPDGVMWFGTWYGGVFRYDGKEFVNFTTKDGLGSNQIEAIHRDSDGLMWFATDGGASGYDGEGWTSLDTRDGLPSIIARSVLQDSDGFLWFATEGGVTRYRRNTTPPKAYMVSVTADRTYRDLSAIPAFTPGTRVTIEYSCIDFKTIPEKRQYRCRIKEIDSDWRKPTKETSSDFIFDDPGTYTFEVQAIDRDLNYSEPASIQLEVITDPRNHRIIQLEEHIRQQELAELERVHRELEDARQIQQSLLPDSPPEIEGFEIAATSLPAREVSGDFYSYLLLGDSTGIALADVTGKSVKAAMVAALADGMLHSEVEERESVWDLPSKILVKLNTRLHPRLIRGMYTAMSLSILQPQAKRLLFSNAGMPYPIVKRGREVWELEVNGMPLGLMEEAEYQDLSLDLEGGDLVVFYSDGVIEAENAAEEMYQTERALELIRQADPDVSAQEMVELIVKDVIAYVGDEEASDDITIAVLRCKE